MVRYEVIKKIKALRQAKEWSIAQLSSKMGFNSQMGYANIENGKTKINLDQLEKIAEIFDTTIEELMGIKNESYEIKELKKENAHLKLKLNDTVRLIKFHERIRHNLTESTIKLFLQSKGLDDKIILEEVEHLLTIHDNYFIEIAKLVSPEVFQTKVIKVKEDIKFLKTEIFNHKKFRKLDKYDQDLVLLTINKTFNLDNISLPIKFPELIFEELDWKKIISHDLNDSLKNSKRRVLYNHFNNRMKQLNKALNYFGYSNFDFKRNPFEELKLNW